MKEIKNNKKLIDDQCSICLDSFPDNQIIQLTPCNHGFHTKCIFSWIETKVKEAFVKKNLLRGQPFDLKTHGPMCPNCGQSLIKFMIYASEEIVSIRGQGV